MSTPEEIAEEVFENTAEIEKESLNEESGEEENEVSEEEEEEEEGGEEEGGDEGLEENGDGEEEDGAGEEGEEEGGEEGGAGEEIVEEMKDGAEVNAAKTNVVNVINNVLEKINNGLININNMFAKKNKSNTLSNGNISNMLDYQEGKESEKEYIQYLEYLKSFYERESKKSIYKKSYENGKLVLTNSKGERITITPSVVVDLHNYKTLLEREVHQALFKIVELVENYSMTNQSQKDEFQKLKNTYITFKKQLSDIENMEESYYQKLKSGEETIANLAVQLNVMKEQRVEVYAKIQSRITQSLKEKLILQFKESQFKKPDLTILTNFSKEYQVPIEDIEHWFEWIEKSYLYMNAQQEYSQIVKEQIYNTNQFDHLMKNYILQKPNVAFG